MPNVGADRTKLDSPRREGKPQKKGKPLDLKSLEKKQRHLDEMGKKPFGKIGRREKDAWGSGPMRTRKCGFAERMRWLGNAGQDICFSGGRGGKGAVFELLVMERRTVVSNRRGQLGETIQKLQVYAA